jgi:valyl-tRNA synthetase
MQPAEIASETKAERKPRTARKPRTEAERKAEAERTAQAKQRARTKYKEQLERLAYSINEAAYITGRHRVTIGR